MRGPPSDLSVWAWQQRLSAIFGPMVIDGAPRCEPESVVHQRLPGCELITGRGPPARFRKPATPTRPDGRLCLFIVDEGRVRIVHAGRHYDLAEGQLALFDQSLDLSFDYDCYYAVRSLMLPATLLGARPERYASLARLNAPIDGGTGYPRIIRRLLDELAAPPAGAMPDLRAGADVLEFTIGRWLDSNVVSNAPVDCRIARISSIVDAHCEAASFDRHALAACAGMSLRSLSRLLAEASTSATELLLAARIDRACGLLGNPLFANATLAHVAERAGFTDSQHFARSFRRRTGLSPREFRCGSMTKP